MIALTVAEAMEAIYQSLASDNEDIDLHIGALKQALAAEGKKEAVFERARLAQNNREGRKTMQSYFRKRGVTVAFDGA